MPNEVINTIHQLAVACNKYKGIVFTDKDGNIINDKKDDTEDNIEISGVEENNYSPDEDNYSQTMITIAQTRVPIAQARESTAQPNTHSKTPSPQEWNKTTFSNTKTTRIFRTTNKITTTILILPMMTYQLKENCPNTCM